jgi:hypothetical protein
VKDQFETLLALGELLKHAPQHADVAHVGEHRELAVEVNHNRRVQQGDALAPHGHFNLAVTQHASAVKVAAEILLVLVFERDPNLAYRSSDDLLTGTSHQVQKGLVTVDVTAVRQ